MAGGAVAGEVWLSGDGGTGRGEQLETPYVHQGQSTEDHPRRAEAGIRKRGNRSGRLQLSAPFIQGGQRKDGQLKTSEGRAVLPAGRSLPDGLLSGIPSP